MNLAVAEKPQSFTKFAAARVLQISPQRVTQLWDAGKMPTPDVWINDHTPAWYEKTLLDWKALKEESGQWPPTPSE